MDRILFGDNQFFGVNHMSEEKARSQSMRFQSLDSILRVLDIAAENGVRSFMCTTHERVGGVTDHVRRDPVLKAERIFLPCMPYAHKYANAMADMGMLGAMRSFLPSEGLLDAALRGGKSLTQKDVKGLTTLLIDAEMKMFEGLRTPVIFLQNVIVDFLLGLGFDDAFAIFAEHVRKRYDAEPGFITMNLPKLVDRLESVGVENPIVCANMNKVAFRMCGGIDAYVETMTTKKFRPVAMSVLASGALSPEEAIQWVVKLPNLESIVFGASSRGNIESTVSTIDRLWASPERVA